jgi:hypothetical protein
LVICKTANTARSSTNRASKSDPHQTSVGGIPSLTSVGVSVCEGLDLNMHLC